MFHFVYFVCDSILYKQTEDDSDYLDVIYGNNIDLLQEDYSNKNNILNVEKIKKITTSSKVVYTLEKKSNFDSSINGVKHSDMISHLMYHSFKSVFSKKALYNDTEIILYDDDTIEHQYTLSRYGENEIDMYENKNMYYGQSVYVNELYIENENMLVIYID